MENKSLHSVTGKTQKTQEVAKMKKYAVIYRGKKVDEIMAASRWDAVVEADRRGYSITMVDVVEVR